MDKQVANWLNEFASLIGSSATASLEGDHSQILGLGMVQAAQMLRRYAKDEIGDRFTLLVVGSFNSGKSTLVNALLGTEAVLTGAVPTTAVLTKLQKGEMFQVMVRPRIGLPYEIDEAAYRRDYNVAGTAKAAGSEWKSSANLALSNWDDIDCLEITGSFEHLPENTSIVDTPGLAEDALRTRLAVEHLPHASAVVMVIDARRSFSKEERDFLALLGTGQLRHVFFVVNRIDTLEEKDLMDVKTRVRERLAPYFHDPMGKVDSDLMAQRLFFVSAIAPSLDQPNNARASSLNELPNFRTALFSAFDAGKDSAAGLQTLLPVLSNVLHRAQRRIEWQLNALEQPFAAVTQQVDHGEEKLQAVARAAETVGLRIVEASRVVQQAVYSDLLQYPQRMKQDWPKDVEMLDLSELGNVNIFSASFSRQEKARIANILSQELQRYLQVKLVQWTLQLPTALQPRVKLLLEDIRGDLYAFNLELSDVATTFATGERLNTDQPKAGGFNLEQSVGSHLFTPRAIVHLVRPITERMVLDLSESSRIKRAGLTALRLLLDAAAYQVKWKKSPLAKSLFSRLGIDLVEQMQRRHDQDNNHRDSQQVDRAYADLEPEKLEKIQQAIKASLVETLGDSLFEDVYEAITHKKEEILAQIASEFEEVGNDISQRLTVAVEEFRSAQQQLLLLKSQRQVSFEQLYEQYKALSVKLRDTFDKICAIAIQRTLSDEEVEALSDRLTLFVACEETPIQVVEVIQPVLVPEPVFDRSSVLPADSVEAVSSRIAVSVKSVLGVEAETLKESHVSQVSRDLANMVGLDTVKNRVVELVNYQAERQRRQRSGLKIEETPSLHLVFTGNPGTGKTTVAQIVGTLYRRLGLLKSGHVISATRADLVGKYLGHTEQKVADIVRKARDGVLFIDEAYSLARTDMSGDFGNIAIEELLSHMEALRGRLAVVVAGYPNQMNAFLKSNPGLPSRFSNDNTIHFPDYSPIELRLILDRLLLARDYSLSKEASVEVDCVIAGLHAQRDREFGNARAMRNLAEALIRRRASRIQQEHLPVDEPIQPVDISERYLQQAEITELTPLVATAHLLDDLIGLKAAKAAIEKLVARAEVSSRLQEPVSADTLHMVFKGAPGTGKTTVASRVGRLLKSWGYLQRGHLITAHRADLIGGVIGQSEAKTRAVIESALDGVLLIDEAYSLFVEDSPRDFGQAIVTELVASMDVHRDRLVVILAGYSDEIEMLLSSNPGLRDRFRTPVQFEDYSLVELVQICRNMASTSGHLLTPAAEEKISLYLETKQNMDAKRFGNARAVRILLDESKDNLALRVNTIKNANEFRKTAKCIDACDIPIYGN